MRRWRLGATWSMEPSATWSMRQSGGLCWHVCGEESSSRGDIDIFHSRCCRANLGGFLHEDMRMNITEDCDGDGDGDGYGILRVPDGGTRVDT